MSDEQWHLVTSFPLEHDLIGFNAFLDERRIVHRFVEAEGCQQLWIANSEQQPSVMALVEKWQRGELDLPDVDNEESLDIDNLLLRTLRLINTFPITLLTIALGLVGAILVTQGSDYITYSWFGFQMLSENGFSTLTETLFEFQWWRLITPVFLHFSALHVVFNCLMLWEAGRRIELAKGSSYFLITFMIIGVASNIVQYMMTPNVPFGGLSGICYGVVGYLAVYQRFISHPVLSINKSLVLILFIWMMLGVVGVIDLVIEGGIANGAHVAGLACGIILGYVEAMRDKGELEKS